MVETGTANAGTTTYAYDLLNRLTGATYPDGSAATWGYDNVGNRVTATATTAGGSAATTTYAYDETNRLCWAAPGTPDALCPSPPANATTYSNDGAGNRTGKVEAGVTTAYGYDAEDRLTSVSVSGTQTAAYTYDGDGYRVGKTAGGTATAYTWDRLGLGAVIADGSGENVFGPAGLQGRLAGGAAQYAHGDGLGSLRLITDAAGSAAGGASYDPWGAPKAGAAATLGGFGFAGEQQDVETGFSYLRARSYDPAAGRFLQQDPAGLAGSGTNLYAYTENNPVTLTDPSGMFLDTLLDVGFISYDLVQLATGGREHLGENLAFLGLDVLGAAIPFATGLGEAARVTRAARVAEHAADLAHVTEEAREVSGKLYRGLAAWDRPGEGIFARSMQTRNTPVSHVAGRWSSRWISTSKDLDAAMYFGRRYGVIEIDASKLITETIDLSSGIPGVPGMLSNWARKYQEVLVLDFIPPEAITRIIK